MIQRRTLLKSGAAAAALGAPGLSALAQQTVTLKFHTFMAPQSNVWINMHKAWMSKVEAESGGRIKFEAYPAMQLGGTPVQLYDQAKDGVVDIVWTLPGNTAGRFPRIEVFELPFMMTNAEATSKAYWEYVQTITWDKGLSHIAVEHQEDLALYLSGHERGPWEATGDVRLVRQHQRERLVHQVVPVDVPVLGDRLGGRAPMIAGDTLNDDALETRRQPQHELSQHEGEVRPLLIQVVVVGLGKLVANGPAHHVSQHEQAQLGLGLGEFFHALQGEHSLSPGVPQAGPEVGGLPEVVREIPLHAIQVLIRPCGDLLVQRAVDPPGGKPHRERRQEPEEP